MQKRNKPVFRRDGDNKSTEKESWRPGEPGALAIARFHTHGHLPAAALLYWIRWRWRKKSKLERRGRQWIAATGVCWAQESGLSYGEYKNKALPILKRLGLIEVVSWKMQGIRQTWISLNEDQLFPTWSEAYEFYEMRRSFDFYEHDLISENHYQKKSRQKKKPKNKLRI